MMLAPPGLPVSRIGAPSSSTMVGAMEERGRLPGSTRLATGAPSVSGVAIGLWSEREVRQLIAEQKNPRHHSIAEAAPARGGGRRHVAGAIDHHGMRRAVLGTIGIRGKQGLHRLPEG